MPRVSRKNLNKNVNNELQENFSFLISSLQSSNDIEQFFQDFLTDEEKIMLTKRLMLHLMLEARYKTVDIQTVLGMSRETIRVHQSTWKKGGKTYKTILTKLTKRQKIKQFWNNVETILKPLELVLTAKTNIKSRAKLFNRDYD